MPRINVRISDFENKEYMDFGIETTIKDEIALRIIKSILPKRKDYMLPRKPKKTKQPEQDTKEQQPSQQP